MSHNFLKAFFTEQTLNFEETDTTDRETSLQQD